MVQTSQFQKRKTRNKSELRKVIADMTKKIVASYQPEKIILFGSYAYGQPTEESDLDLLIIKDTQERPIDRRVRVRRIVADPGRRIPFSPLVLTPQELSYRLAVGDPFYKEIVSRGEVLYAR